MLAERKYLGFSVAFSRPRDGKHGTARTGPITLGEQIEAVQTLRDYHLYWVGERVKRRECRHEDETATREVFDAILATLRAAE